MENDINEPYLETMDVIDDPSILRQLSSQQGVFSHETLVMIAYQKVLNNSAKEMRKGYWEQKHDKVGNNISVYNPDTRQELINSVLTLDIVTYADQDKEARDNIKRVYLKLTEVYQSISKQEDDYFKRLSFQERNKLVHVEGKLNQDLHFYQSYINIGVDYYRDIFKEVELLLSRTKYFKKKLNIA